MMFGKMFDIGLACIYFGCGILLFSLIVWLRHITSDKSEKTIVYTVSLLRDNDAKVWIAIEEDSGLVLEDANLDHLIERSKLALPEMIEENDLEKAEKIEFSYIVTVPNKDIDAESPNEVKNEEE